MSASKYKELIKQLIEPVEDESLLKHWKEQLEWDTQHQSELVLSDEEWMMVQEGIKDYEKANIITLEGFISKRK